MDEFQILQQKVEELEGVIEKLNKSDRYTFLKLLQLLDGRNIQLGRSTGTQIGTDTDQKLGFYGVDPVDQPATVSDPTGGGDAASHRARPRVAGDGE